MVFTATRTLLIALVVLSVSVLTTQGRLSGECAMLCNDLRTEVLTLEICRDAKRTLPRPKVGDFCSTAMEQGFSDACVALCMEQPPVARVAQTCRSAAIEMPRPTVRRWCEHGYNVAFTKTVRELSSYFAPAPSAADIANAEAAANAARAFNEGAARTTLESEGQAAYRESAEGAAANAAPVLATIPVTLDDSETTDLLVREGQTAEEAVVLFCRTHVSSDVGACIRQLLPVVLEKLHELGVSA